MYSSNILIEMARTRQQELLGQAERERRGRHARSLARTVQRDAGMRRARRDRRAGLALPRVWSEAQS